MKFDTLVKEAVSRVCFAVAKEHDYKLTAEMLNSLQSLLKEVLGEFARDIYVLGGEETLARINTAISDKHDLDADPYTDPDTLDG